MTKIFNYCFGEWWRTILFGFAAALTLVFSEIVGNVTFGNIAFVFFGVGLLAILISVIYLLAQQEWLKGLASLGIFVGLIVMFIFASIARFMIDQEKPDNWAKNLKIPTNIPMDNPVDLDFNKQRPDSITNRKVIKMDFQLYNAFQPGLYQYDFWTDKIESGIIYLKVFEITQESALSTNRLPQKSAVKIYNPTDSIKKFGTTTHFTIYEGDWNQPYAARFEVWFKPDKDGQERKLFTKNYKIEGWMR